MEGSHWVIVAVSGVAIPGFLVLAWYVFRPHKSEATFEGMRAEVDMDPPAAGGLWEMRPREPGRGGGPTPTFASKLEEQEWRNDFLLDFVKSTEGRFHDRLDSLGRGLDALNDRIFAVHTTLNNELMACQRVSIRCNTQGAWDCCLAAWLRPRPSFPRWRP